MLNRVVLVGRLTKDPEYRTTPSGVSVATFTLAVNRTFTNAQGEREADNVNNYLSKGSLAGVDGRLQSRNYENQEGRRVFVTEVVCDSVQFLEPKNAQQNGGQRQQNEFQDYGQGFGGQQSGQNNSYNNSSNTKQSDNPFANANGPIDISDDDLPF